MSALSDEELQRLFVWVDTIPLSRAKKNINRDFSDGVLAAEVVAYYFPKLVDLHNYTPASSQKQKLANWATLNHKVLRKIKHHLAPPTIDDLVNAKPGAVEAFLHTLQYKLARHKAEKQFHSQQLLHQHQHQHSAAMGATGFTVGTCVIDGEEAEAEAAPLDASDPHIPPHAHYHAFHLHPHPYPPASSSSSSPTGSAFARGSGSSPRRLQDGNNSALTSPFLSPDARPPASSSSLQMGAATERRVGGKGAKEAVRREVDEEILVEKEETIQELGETVELLELKLAKLEQLLRLKDGKIQRLSDELARVTLAGGEGEGAQEGDGVVGEGRYEEAPYV